MNDPASGPGNSERLRDQVFSARLEAIEARMDARIASLEATINALIRRVEEKFAEIDARFVQIDNRFAQIDNRFAQIDNRFAQMEGQIATIKAELGGVKSSIGGLRTTIVVTAIGAVIGVAAFNATVLNNMLASFESGRNVSAAQAQIQRQAEETAALLRQIQQGLPPPAKK
jgi:anti-sigma-K factor RskA